LVTTLANDLASYHSTPPTRGEYLPSCWINEKCELMLVKRATASV